MRSNQLKHPKELFILALTEMCERYAFWGVGNLLVLYMVQHYDASAASAAKTYGVFAGFAAFLPLLGGYLVDKWNYHYPLFLGALVNSIGCFMIALGSRPILYLALGVMALGYGFFTPAILTLLGNAYKKKSEMREKGFSIYYASINVGVFAAMVSLGFVAHTFGWHYCWIVAGSVQGLGLIPIIIYLKKHYDFEPNKIREEKKRLPKLSKIEKDRIIVILVLIAFSLFFWMPYIQAFSSMAIFGLKFTDRWIGSYEFPTSWLLSAEPFFLLLLAPILVKFYGFLSKAKKNPSPAMKTALGLFSSSVFFLIMAIAALSFPAAAKSAHISVLIPIGAYFFLALGEMLLAPIGLSLISHLAPKRYNALLIGVWYVCVGVSFYLGGLMAGLIEKISWPEFFALFVLLTFSSGLVLTLFASKLSRMSHKNLEDLDKKEFFENQGKAEL